jgi:translation elongation factor EF-G
MKRVGSIRKNEIQSSRNIGESDHPIDQPFAPSIQYDHGRFSILEAPIASSARHITYPISPSAGRIQDKNTILDTDSDEKERGYSIYTAIAHCNWKKRELHIFDCPGYPDFIGAPFLDEHGLFQAPFDMDFTYLYITLHISGNDFSGDECRI